MLKRWAGDDWSSSSALRTLRTYPSHKEGERLRGVYGRPSGWRALLDSTTRGKKLVSRTHRSQPTKRQSFVGSGKKFLVFHLACLDSLWLSRW